MSTTESPRTAPVTARTLDQFSQTLAFGGSVSFSDVTIHNSELQIPDGNAPRPYANANQIHVAPNPSRSAQNLGHEAIHASHLNGGRVDASGPVRGEFSSAEEMGSIVVEASSENQLRTEERDLPPRPTYGTRSHEPSSCARPARDLDEIQARAVQPDFYPCGEANPHQHQRIRNEVLPYFIEQRQKGLAQKPTKPGAACQRLADTLRRLKDSFRNDGKNEKPLEVSLTLTQHFLTSDCALAKAIVSEMFGERATLWIKSQCTEEAAAKLICEQIHTT